MKIAHSRLGKNLHTFFSMLIFALIFSSCDNNSIENVERFDGRNAFDFVSQQLSFGPRVPGSIGHELTIELIEATLISNGWETENKSEDFNGYEVNNVIGKKGEGKPWIMIGAHYDTRIFADQESLIVNQGYPVPGANDGGSGVGILLELARVIPEFPAQEIWLVFFDQEDNGNINGQDWIIGSTIFVEQLEDFPDKVVILDMVGDDDLNIFFEKSSDSELSNEIWGIAGELGYSEYFISEYRFNMIDDHTPFIQKGISAIDIIDFDYPYWHTTEDTLDKISADSLEIVGSTILEWILRNQDR
jgi:glutaminyl-peptide cyclotransferase